MNIFLKNIFCMGLYYTYFICCTEEQKDKKIIELDNQKFYILDYYPNYLDIDFDIKKYNELLFQKYDFDNLYLIEEFWSSLDYPECHESLKILKIFNKNENKLK